MRRNVRHGSISIRRNLILAVVVTLHGVKYRCISGGSSSAHISGLSLYGCTIYPIGKKTVDEIRNSPCSVPDRHQTYCAEILSVSSSWHICFGIGLLTIGANDSRKDWNSTRRSTSHTGDRNFSGWHHRICDQPCARSHAPHCTCSSFYTGQRGFSSWSYAWIPVVGPIVGGI